MNKLANLALSAIVGTSILASGCTVYVHEHVRPRVIHHEHPRNVSPTLVICYEWPSHDHYCHHQSCYDRYVIELRHRYDQYRNWGKPFEYQTQKQAFPHEPKAERRGAIKIEAREKEKSKEQRRAFPKPDKPQRHFQEVDDNTGP